MKSLDNDFIAEVRRVIDLLMEHSNKIVFKDIECDGYRSYFHYTYKDTDVTLAEPGLYADRYTVIINDVKLPNNESRLLRKLLNRIYDNSMAQEKIDKLKVIN